MYSLIRLLSIASWMMAGMMVIGALVTGPRAAYAQSELFMCSQCPTACCTNNGAYCLGTGGCPSGCVGCACAIQGSSKLCG